MDPSDKKIYENLLSDSRFIVWASGKDETDNAYWQQWQEDHPGSVYSFNEARRTVQLFRFKVTRIPYMEITGRWLASRRKMKSQFFPISSTGTVYWFRKIAGFLIFPLLILSGWLFYHQKQLESEAGALQAYSREKSVHLVAPLGGRLQVELPDGSIVWMNSGSEINYPACFPNDKREVEMTGEIYFQVSKSDNMFIVKNPGPTIMVHGTEFNVHAYADEAEVTIALEAGSIALEKEGDPLMMVPGEVVTFNRSTQNLIRQKTSIYPYTSWREGKYIFKSAPLEKILKTLERNYNVRISLEDLSMNQYTYDATINGEPLEQILELLTFSAPLKYTYKRQELNPDGTYSKSEVRLWRDTAKVIHQKK